MAINIIRPYWLFLLPAVFVLIWFSRNKLNKMYKLRKRMILCLRGLVLTFLVLALAGLNISWSIDTITTVFAIDASDSMKAQRDEVEKFVREALENKGTKDQVGIIAFGGNALVESFIGKDTTFAKLETSPNGTYTNIENALNLGLSMIPQKSRKRIVLITDGEENTGISANTAGSIAGSGAELKVYKIERQLQNEVAVESVDIPKKLNVGEQFNVVVNIKSGIKTNAKITLYSGRQKVGEQKVELQKGNNRFVFRDKAEAGGFKTYRAAIEPDNDTEIRNNEASAFTNIYAKPVVLIIEDSKGESDEITKILRASNIDYRVLSAESAPTAIQELAAYKSVITCNVSADNLPEGFLNSIEAYVRDFGGGFIATGGDNSFALGGYFKTPLEKILPVHMDLRGKKEIPDMSIVLIIDKSGSMTEGMGGIMKLDLAKEAAARTLDSLRPDKDYIGVLTFDDTNYWVVETQKIKDTEKIRDDIGTIRPGGGTSIIPALEEGYESIKKVNSKIKHIILLTDGQAEKTGYAELLERIKKDNITVSTVAVGSNSDVNLLETIAKGASGRFYYTDEFSNIPRIFAKETFMAARAYLNNREFTPIIANDHPVLSGAADKGLPSLLGYVGATTKDTARMVLSSDEGDPILSLWQYGLGKTAAWNSDINGRWSANFVQWGKNLILWQNLINWTIENYSEGNIEIDVKAEGGKGIIRLINKDAKEELESKAIVTTPSLETVEVNLYAAAPGEYEGSFDIIEPGSYIIKALQQSGGEIEGAVNTGLSVQYSPEYKLNPPLGYLDRLVKETGGSFIKSAEEVFKGSPKKVMGTIDLTSMLLILALLLYMLDIALRRLNLPLHKLEEKIAELKKKLANEKKKPVMKTLQPQKTKGEKLDKIAEEVGRADSTEKPKEKNAEKPKDTALDTSALLKRKQDRSR